MELKRVLLIENAAIVSALRKMSADELIELLLSEREEHQKAEDRLKKERKKNKELKKACKDADEMNSRLAESINNLEKEKSLLAEKVRDTAEYYKSAMANLYGSKSEKLRSIMREAAGRLDELLPAEKEKDISGTESSVSGDRTDPQVPDSTGSEDPVPGSEPEKVKRTEKDSSCENPDGSYKNVPNPRKGNKGRNKGKKKSGVKDKQISGLKEKGGCHSEERVLSPSELLAACGAGCRFHHWETVTHVEYIPGKLVVHEEKVAVYAKKDGTGTVRASRETAELFRNCVLSPSLGAFLITSRYMDYLPCYHIHKKLERMGLSVSRQTVTNWNRMLGDRKLRVIYNRMKRYLVTELHYIQADETPQRVQDDGLGSGSVDRVWLFRSSELLRDGPKIILFAFRRGRSLEDLQAVLTEEFSGYITTDAYVVYHSLDEQKEGIYVTNCWAHSRRLLADAVKAMEKKTEAQKQKVLDSVSWKALSKIRDIYHMENSLKELTAEERKRQRQLVIRPLVDDFFEWIREAEKDESLSKKSKTMRGIRYCLNQETYLRRFLEDGNIPLDNSAAERVFRSYVLLRDRCGQITSLVGAEATAIIMSIVETAKANGLNVEAYMEYLLTEIARAEKEEKKSGMPVSEDYYDQFLPWSSELPGHLRIQYQEKSETQNEA